MEKLLLTWAFITENKELFIVIIPIVFEIVARRKPTEKDWSILNLIKRIVDALVKNKKKRGDRH